MEQNTNFHSVIIVGAGAAGLGLALLLQRLAVDYVVLEQDCIGASFRHWPRETRFISPSFTGNFFKMPDLNGISPETSPAFNLLTEHPTGREYADHLEGVAEYYELNIVEGRQVQNIQKNGDIFHLYTNAGAYTSQFLVWAGGEFQFPKKNAFQGAEHCLHYADIQSFSQFLVDVPTDACATSVETAQAAPAPASAPEQHENAANSVQESARVIIGAYESGWDASVHLAQLGYTVQLLDSENSLSEEASDSSYALSPYTRDRIRTVEKSIDYYTDSRVKAIEYAGGEYIVKCEDSQEFRTKHKPINCTGFAGAAHESLAFLGALFEFSEGYPLLSEHDESMRCPGAFLIGPQVKHKHALFCFIYKFRQRFAIVAERIASQLEQPPENADEVMQEYKDYNFYLSDLSCCDNDCAC